MQLRFTTSDLPPAARVTAWEHAWDSFGKLDIEHGAEDLHGELERASLGMATVTRIAGSAQRVRRRPRRDPLSETFNVLVQLDGTCEVCCRGERVNLRRRQFVAVDGASEFTLTQPGPFRQVLFSFPRQMAGSLLTKCLRASSEQFSSDALVLDQLAVAARHAGSLDASSAAYLAEASLHMLGAASAFSPTLEPPSLVPRALELIEAHLHEPGFDVAALHALMPRGSRRLLEQHFARVGITPSRELWGRRVRRAVAMLRDPANDGRTLLDVALSCGFASAPHFTRTFRVLVGASPSEYRKRRAASDHTIRATRIACPTDPDPTQGSP